MRNKMKDNLINKKLYLLDMDGTIYIDDVLFDATLDFLDFIKSIGGRYVFLTNNSSKSIIEYISKLTYLGIEADKTNFLTSSQATALYLRENYMGKKIYVLGTKSLKKELKEYDIYVVDIYEEGIDCLVVGYDTELTYKKLVEGSRLLTEGWILLPPILIMFAQYPLAMYQIVVLSAICCIMPPKEGLNLSASPMLLWWN